MSSKVGSTEHSVMVLDQICDQDKVITFLSIKDDSTFNAKFLITDTHGNPLYNTVIGNSGTRSGTIYKLEDKYLLYTQSTINNSIKPLVVLLDKEGKILAETNVNNIVQNVYGKYNICEDNNIIYASSEINDSTNFVLTIDKSNTMQNILNVNCKTVYSDNTYNVVKFYTNGKKLFYSYFNMNDYVTYFAEYKNETNITKQTAKNNNIYTDEKNKIDNVKFFCNKIYIKGNVLTVYDLLTKETNTYDEEEVIQIDDELYVLITKDVENQIIKIETSNQDSCYITYSDDLNYSYMDGGVIISNSESLEDVIIDSFGNIKTVCENEQHEILDIGENFITRNTEDINYIHVYNLNKMSLSIDKINDKELDKYDSVIYCGTNGLKIEGHTLNGYNNNLRFKIGNNIKDLYNVNGEFVIVFASDEIKEGFYDNIVIELLDDDKNFMYFDEIPLGAELYLNNVLYTKLDSSLAYEKYMHESKTVKRSSVSSSAYLDDLLTEAEYTKYKDYIYDDSSYIYWLSSCNAINNKAIYKVKSTNKTYQAYKRFKLHVDMNTKFRFNKNDNKYYQIDDELSNKFYISIPIRVSYRECNNVKTILSPGMLSNDDIILSFVADDSNDIDDYVSIMIYKNNELLSDEKIKIKDFKINGDIRIYEKKFTDSAKYYCNTYTYNDFGNRSQTKRIDFVLDKDKPEVIDVTFSNVYEYKDKKWSNKKTNEVKLLIKDSTDITSDYDVTVKSDGLYEITLDMLNKENINVKIIDSVNNVTLYNIETDYEVDDIKPIIRDIKINDYDDRQEINIYAYDNESDIKDTKYYVSKIKVDNPYLLLDEFKSSNKITLYKKDYDRNTYLYCFSLDHANNMSEIIETKLNLNSKPEITVFSNYDKNDIKFTLGNIPEFNVDVFDEDTEEIVLSILLNDELLFSNAYIQNGKLLLNLEDYINFILDLKYDEKYKLEFILTDGLECVNEVYYITKHNMKPDMNIKIKDVNFTNYSEIEININDIDKEPYDILKLKILKGTNVIYESIVQSGYNKIVLKNLDEGENKLIFKLYDYEYVVSKNNIVSTLANDKVCNNDVVVLNINESYDNEFYGNLLDRFKNAKMILLNYADEVYNNYFDILYNANDIYSSKVKDIVSLKIAGFNNALDEKTLEQILKAFDDDDAIYLEAYNDFYLSDIYLDDYDNDYRDFENKYGDERMLSINYDHLNFENVKDNFNEVIDFYNDSVNYKNYVLNVDSSGEYNLILNEKDHAIYDKDYSKKSSDECIKIFAHKKPFCMLTYDDVSQDSIEKVIRVNKEAYDMDFYNINKGISKIDFIVSTYSYKGELINKEIKTYYKNDLAMFDDEIITIDKNYITNIDMVVYDFGMSLDEEKFILSNSYSLSIKNQIDKPFADFDYYLKDEISSADVFADSYIYKYESRIENLFFKEYLDFNDFFSVNIHHSNKYDYELNEFKDKIVNESNYDLVNKLEITNSYQQSYCTNEKSLRVEELDLYNKTTLSYDEVDGFKTSKDLNLLIDVINVRKQNDIYLYANGIKMIEYEKGKYSTWFDKSYIDNLIIDNKNNDEQFALIPFKIDIKSARDNSYLGSKTIEIKYYNSSEIIDFYITNVYDNKLKLSYPIDIYNMPVETIKKGYAFDFEILTKGMSSNTNAIKIDVNYFYVDENKNLIDKIDLKKRENNKYISYDMPILFNEVPIGSLNNIILTNKECLSDCEKWKGRFFIPLDTEVIINGERKNDGYILVVFDINAFDENNIVYSFNSSKWSSVFPRYVCGNTALYSNKYSINDDFGEYVLY
ncbi:MAG: hypothetical protein MJ245_01600 [Clostridia bacterium]|nr:hypothetical protein [Clostridia bacterium]